MKVFNNYTGSTKSSRTSKIINTINNLTMHGPDDGSCLLKHTSNLFSFGPFFMRKLHTHPMSLEPMTSSSIPLLWEKEVPIEL